MICQFKGVLLGICFSALAFAGGDEMPNAGEQRIALAESHAVDGLVALKFSRPNSVVPTEVTPQPKPQPTPIQPRTRMVHKIVRLAKPREVTDAELQNTLDDYVRSEQERILKMQQEISQKIQTSLDNDGMLYALYKASVTGLSERERKKSQAQLVLKLQHGKRYRDYQRSLWPRPTKTAKKVPLDTLRQLMCLDEEIVTVEEPVS